MRPVEIADKTGSWEQKGASGEAPSIERVQNPWDFSSLARLPDGGAAQAEDQIALSSRKHAFATETTTELWCIFLALRNMRILIGSKRQAVICQLPKPIAMTTDIAPSTRALLMHVRERFALDWDGIHGAKHWARVRHYGLRIGRLRGADLQIIELFAFLHDSCRENDWSDPHHGDRAADFAANLNGRFFDLSPTRMDTLCFAILGHSNGHVAQDVTIQTCWDADRLDLGRVGIVPDPRFLSIEAIQLIGEATQRFPSVSRNR